MLWPRTGRWPSAANMPEVGSRPIQPAPGRETSVPGVEVGEVGLRALWALDRFLVRDQLNQVPGHEPAGQSKPPQRLGQEPRAVSARPASPLQRLLAGLHPRLHTDDVVNVLRHPVVQIEEEVDRPTRCQIDRLDELPQASTFAALLEVGPKILRQPLFVTEREFFGRRLEEEVERIDHRQLGDQVDLDRQLSRALGEHRAGQVVAVRILLPVQEMGRGLDP